MTAKPGGITYGATSVRRASLVDVGGVRRICSFITPLAFVGVGGCSVSGPETALETAYSAVGAQVK
jgi:hypothetical protein